MPNGYRIRQVNRFENVGSPAVRTFQSLQRSGQRALHAFGSGGSQRGGIATSLSIGRDEHRRHGNSAGRAGMDDAGGSCVN